MQHSRSDEFNRALESTQDVGPTGRWSALSLDPNAAIVLARRAERLRSAWRPSITDRIQFLEERCKGRLVLDIGCVAHDAERMNSSNWLHGRLAAVARRCVGVDVLTEGVDAMRQRGFEVVLHDLGSGLGPLADDGPFEVIVAGELIEHVGSLDMLFKVASEVLADDGEMVITTPNPYAPHRVRAAQLGIVWENVDHILYAFPSGMAELAERHGLVLAEAATTDDSLHLSITDRLRAVKRRLRSRQWTNVGYSTVGGPRVDQVGFGPIGNLLHGMWWPGRRFLGETFVYVVKRGSAQRADR